MRLLLRAGAVALASVAALLTLKIAADTVEVPTTGKADADLASFDRLMTDFLRTTRLPGGTLAVTRNGRTVYARGFGYADAEKKQPVPSDALFRIASISKPITAVAILQLVERGKLKLDERVFEFLGLKVPDAPGVKFDERWKKVTVLQLLYHRGGWDSARSFDPMFRSSEIVREMKSKPPAMPAAIIGYMLRQPLDFDPGTRYAYSNFGYCLLGRVVEKVSGKKYDEYIKREVLAPLNIHRMRLGHTLIEDRAEGEVAYFDRGEGPFVMGPNLGKPARAPYGAFCLEALDSHGGWIASAEDLARFAAAFNEPAKCKVLKEKSVQRMFARPETDGGDKTPVYYGCGWQVRQVGDGAINFWHTGSLPGTSTLLVRRSDNLTWAVLFNSRQSDKGTEPASAIDSLVHKAADAVTHWPDR